MGRNSSIEESATWGEGYDAGQSGILKAVETAGVIERIRITNLITRYRDTWVKSPSFNFRAEMTKLIEEINNV